MKAVSEKSALRAQEAFKPARIIAAASSAGPPASQANAETAVATLKESRFKEELQKALEDCNAELEDCDAEPSDSRAACADTAAQAPAQPAKDCEAGVQAVEALTRDNSMKIDNSQAAGVLGSQQSPAASGGRPISPIPDSIVPVWARSCVVVVEMLISLPSSRRLTHTENGASMKPCLPMPMPAKLAHHF